MGCVLGVRRLRPQWRRYSLAIKKARRVWNLAGFCVRGKREWLGEVTVSSNARQPGQLSQPLVAHGHLLLPVAKPVQQGCAFGVPVGTQHHIGGQVAQGQQIALLIGVEVAQVSGEQGLLASQSHQLVVV